MSSKNEEQQNNADVEAEDLAETTVLPEDFSLDAENEDELCPEDALAKAEAAAEENWNKYLRIVAEMDNLRKRHTRDLENAHRFGVEGLAGELLTVADSLEMALETGVKAPAESLLEGGRATLKQLQTAMEKYGVTVISPEGEPFDPELHEALTMQESDTTEPDTVLTVVQRGYQLNGRLLRPARVIVAKEP
ncbi:MAG: nucleotide exchange factor GrpE [Gammaproteobacteria bacterium]|nr:nucleotide exchange factor GrpE [Gammaproteobacteria bacterium]MCP4091193.1 nucleotide exchange factor GrpE [Gammaproteobacteria bacterium]MCP4277786.1 nucleotide exchange factor GrpE [Gammaproteobacteria bacterium]MCP4831658.1 nucleotide exchange factor GrpE [Gammaproteobacteria bacterium]MCP4929316.1 nucleotide exchange factor GrpE [Gammaproteobacteria bacterium]